MASESNTILQCISGLLHNESRDCMPNAIPCGLAQRYTRHFFGPSSYSLRNECSANHMAEKNIIFVSLSCDGFV